MTASVSPSNATNQNLTWSSNAPAVATVSSNGLVTGVSVGSATITVITEDGNKTATCAVTVNAAPVAVTSVTLNKTYTSLTVGGSETLVATIEPSNATNKNVTWSSNNNAVATVSNGVVSAKASGTTGITVTTQDGGFSAECAVTVSTATTNVTFSSLTANGSSTQTTTQVTLTFSTSISGLSASDIALSGVNNITKGELSGSNPYTLPISGFTADGTLGVSVTKDGYNISGSPKTVTIFYIVPDISVTFSSLTANGSSTQTTTELTLTFSAGISGLSASDIILSNTSIIKGTLSSGSGNSYTLPISNLTVIETLSVSVAKTGYTITGSPKTVAIYIAPVIVTPDNLQAYLDTLNANTIINPYPVSIEVTSANDFTTIRTSLNGAPNKYVTLDLTSSTLTAIPNSAFYGSASPFGCATLTGITIPSSVNSIGAAAFSGCSKLANITIPSSVNSIGNSAFANTSLVNVTIPSSVITIGSGAFMGCSSLASVNIENGTTSIGDQIFTNCTSLASVTIPSSVNSIGTGAFSNCTSLANVEFQGTIPSSGFSSSAPFPGDLRTKFYETDSTNGTPGKYTTANPGSNPTWTKEP